MLLPRYFLVVRVGENDGQFAACQRFVIVFLLIDPQSDAFILDGLAGTVNRAVGEENRLRLRARFLPVLPIINPHIARRSEFAPVVARA